MGFGRMHSHDELRAIGLREIVVTYDESPNYIKKKKKNKEKKEPASDRRLGHRL
jgi:hypothetical protein